MAIVSNDIYLYANGVCKANEFIEDDCFSFNNDGSIHYVRFIEGASSIIMDSTAFYASELLEGVIISRLTDESDVYLIDESGNRLTTIV